MNQSSLIRQAFLSTAGVLVQGLSRFAYTILIGNLVGRSELAHVSAFLSLAIIVSLFWPTGAGNAAGHFLSRALATGQSPTRVLKIIKRSFLFSCIPLVLAGVAIAVVALDASWSDSVVVAALIVSWSGYILTRGIQAGLGRVETAATWDLISAVLTIVMLLVVIAGGQSWALLWPITLGYTLFAVVNWGRSSSGHQEMSQDETSTVAEISRITAWNSAGLVASNGLIQFAMVFVFAVSDALEAGLFAAAMSLATPASMLAQATSQVLIPRFSSWIHTERELARGRYVKVLMGMTIGLAVVFLAVVAITPWLLPFVYRNGYDDAVPMLQVLLIGVFAFSVGLIATSFLITSGRTVNTTVFALIGSAIGVALMVLLTSSQGGAIAASLGVSVGYAITAVGTVWTSLRPLRPSRG